MYQNPLSLEHLDPFRVMQMQQHQRGFPSTRRAMRRAHMTAQMRGNPIVIPKYPPPRGDIREDGRIRVTEIPTRAHAPLQAAQCPMGHRWDYGLQQCVPLGVQTQAPAQAHADGGECYVMCGKEFGPLGNDDPDPDMYWWCLDKCDELSPAQGQIAPRQARGRARQALSRRGRRQQTHAAGGVMTPKLCSQQALVLYWLENNTWITDPEPGERYLVKVGGGPPAKGQTVTMRVNQNGQIQNTQVRLTCVDFVREGSHSAQGIYRADSTSIGRSRQALSRRGRRRKKNPGKKPSWWIGEWFGRTPPKRIGSRTEAIHTGQPIVATTYPSLSDRGLVGNPPPPALNPDAYLPSGCHQSPHWPGCLQDGTCCPPTMDVGYNVEGAYCCPRRWQGPTNRQARAVRRAQMASASPPWDPMKPLTVTPTKPKRQSLRRRKRRRQALRSGRVTRTIF